MRMTSKEMEKLPEIELIRIVNDPNSPEVDYNIAAEILIKKYEKMIHYHWWKLQKELNNTGYVNSIKEDFYDEAYEALLKAITKVDLNRIENDNFKILQLASWYITNVRTKMRKRVLTRVSKNKGLVAVNLDDGEDTNVIDSEVEKAYNDEFGYRTDPVYSYEVKEGEDNCKSAVKKCFDMWDDEQKRIYRYLENGKNKTEISRLMGIPTTKVYSLTKKMKADMKKALDYDHLRYSYN